MRRAFTLIELLIVVGIIAILAGIAVVNFLEAQTRSKVARARSDMRTLATAIEMYTTDHNRPPDTFGLIKTTTPVAYITGVTHDVFALPDSYVYLGYMNAAQMSTPEELENWDVSGSTPEQRAALAAHSWFIWSNGPDTESTTLEDRTRSFRTVVDAQPTDLGLFYDPTNGTISRGDLLRYPK